MSSWLIALTGAIYFAVAVMQYMKGDAKMAIVYTGYSFSNVGLYLLAK